MEESTRGVCAAVNKRGGNSSRGRVIDSLFSPLFGLCGKVGCVCVMYTGRERIKLHLYSAGRGVSSGEGVDAWRRKPFIVERGGRDSDEIKSAQWEV